MSENFNFQINSILSGFGTISLNDIDSKDLLNRQDKKYIFHTELLPNVLSNMAENYSVLNIDNIRIFNYLTIYYDTDRHDFYIQHHNGKQTRNKVRSRYYKESNKTFFEVKSKTNKSKTIKKRVLLKEGQDGLIDFNKEISIDEISEPISSAVNLLKKNLDISPTLLKPRLSISYSRITLLHKVNNEKITIDFDISFKPLDITEDCYHELVEGQLTTRSSQTIRNLVIAETKQERLQGLSEFEQVMSKLHIRSTSISKYCTGLILTNPEIKHNRFKRKMNYIHKINGNDNGL
ncbi:MAG: polyphosphate polymerase domain-containing protein [bacterium]